MEECDVQDGEETKTSYELFRDQCVAEVKEAAKPAEIAAAHLRKSLAPRKQFKDVVKNKPDGHNVRKSSRLHAGNRLREGLRGKCSDGKQRPTQTSKMSIDAESVSADTKTNEEAIAAGKVGTKEKVFDSDDDDLEPVEASCDSRQKRKTASIAIRSPTRTPLCHAGPSSGGSYGNSWHWVPGQWMPQPALQPPPWGMGAPPPAIAYTERWPSDSQCHDGNPTAELSPDSATRACRRYKQMQYEQGSRDRDRRGRKPHRITVNASGEIDGGCEGKNAWDTSVRSYVPRILDMSVIDWEKQKPESVKKLRDTLDRDFEYIGHSLSMLGFRNAIKRFLKTERSRLKAHFLSGNEDCPIHVDPHQWEDLQEYWQTDQQQKKSATMAHARRQVKNYSTVGRKGKAGKEALLVHQKQGKDISPGITEVAEAMQLSEAHVAQASVLTVGDSARICTIEKTQTDLLASTAANNRALEELKSMFSAYMGRFKGIDYGCPSVSKSTLENAVLVENQAEVEAAQVMPDSSPELLAIDDVVAEHGPIQNMTPSNLPLELEMHDCASAAAPKEENVGEEMQRASEGSSAQDCRLAAPIRSIVNVLPVEPTVVAPLCNAEVHVEVVKDLSEPDNAAPPSSDGNMKKGEVDAKIRPSYSENPYSLGGNVEGIINTSGKRIEAQSMEPNPSPKKQKRNLKSANEKKAGRRDTRSKTTAVEEKKSEAGAQKFCMGDEVFLMNPRSIRQKVAMGNISGIGGVDKFHFMDIPDSWFKVDVREVLQPNVQLMFPNEDAEQVKMEDVKGSNALWDQKYMKFTT